MHRAQSLVPPLRHLVPVLILAAMLAAFTVPLLSGTPAHAASYRFWGYYHGDAKGGWAFATTGGDAYKPADGSVEGYRFAISGDSDARFPRTKADFAAACANTTAQSGMKRVAVYIDFGIDVEAPTGSTPPPPAMACALVPTKATGADVIAKVEKLRTEKGLICGIGGFPATGCGDSVKTAPKVPSPEPSVDFAAIGAPAATVTAAPDAATAPVATTTSASPQAASDADDGSRTGTYVLVAVLAAALIGGGGLFLARRNRG